MGVWQNVTQEHLKQTIQGLSKKCCKAAVYTPIRFRVGVHRLTRPQPRFVFYRPCARQTSGNDFWAHVHPGSYNRRKCAEKADSLLECVLLVFGQAEQRHLSIADVEAVKVENCRQDSK